MTGRTERLLPAQRLAALRAYLQARQDPVVDLPSLAEHVGVSIQTVRRDLAVLEADGVVHRTFGGAVVQPVRQRVEPAIVARYTQSADLKAAIADAALTLFRHESGVYFDASTTVLALADRVPGDWTGSATTSSLPTTRRLAERTQCSLTLLGGQYRPASECVGGLPALHQVAHQRFSTAYLSCRALSIRHGLTEARQDEASLKRAVMDHSERTVLLVDSTKLETVAAHHFADLGAVDVMVVDDRAPEQLIDRLRSTVAQVVVAPV